jgi:hypothetical protein
MPVGEHRLYAQQRVLQHVVRQRLLRAEGTVKYGALALLAAAAGCAHLDGELTPPDRAVVAQFASVRDGAAGKASANGYHFRRSRDSVVVSRSYPRVSDEEAYVIADESIAASVDEQLKQDPALARTPLAARVADHEVYLRGTADDPTAARAIFDVLRLPGVDAVFANLDRPVAR